MTDDRDWSWMPPPAPAPPVFAEHRVWMLTKRTHQAEARVRATPAGPELRILLDGELWWSQLFQPATEAGMTDVADRKRGEFLAKGWSTP